MCIYTMSFSSPLFLFSFLGIAPTLPFVEFLLGPVVLPACIFLRTSGVCDEGTVSKVDAIRVQAVLRGLHYVAISLLYPYLGQALY